METRLLPMLKTFRFPRLAFHDWRKHQLFEKFLREDLKVTKREYADSQQLKNACFDYDAYISGSDQIWNTHCYDYDSAYFFDFITDGIKIAYAPSMGPRPEIEVGESYDSVIKQHLSTYNFISVREDRTADRVEHIIGKRPLVCLDPTLLLNQEDWYSMVDSVSCIQGDYILLYTPLCDERMYEKAVKLAKEFNLKVVVTLPNHYFRYRKNRYMEFYTVVGPKEFLNLVRFSKFVICKSFHAVIFSLIFSRPFYAMDGMNDSRIANLLNLTGLESFAKYPQRSILELENDVFSSAFTSLEPAKDKSIKFLQNALS